MNSAGSIDTILVEVSEFWKRPGIGTPTLAVWCGNWRELETNFDGN